MLAYPLSAKANMLLCCTLALAACGGSGEAPANNSSANQAPTNVVLTTVQARSSDVIDVAWDLAKDDKTIANALTYQVHLSEAVDFSPSNNTLKYSQKGSIATQLTGLKSATTYHIKLVVIDDDGAQTVGAEKVVTTPTLNVINQAPTNVVLSGATALSTTAVNVFWSAASDDSTPADQLTYEVYIAEGGIFTPSATTFKFSGKNALSTQITGLKVSTAYTTMLVAIDAQGLRTVSSGVSVKTQNPIVTAPIKLNDTGITQCGNDNTILFDCSAANLVGWFGLNQDGEVGRDFLAFNGNLSKVGAGDAGFDFTKISATGQNLPANATAWSCVLDNQTGLMWEVKTDDGGLRDKDNTYSWYNPDTNTNGGIVGYENGGNNTQAFSQAVNAQSLCGYTDWRLPKKQELHSILNYGKYNQAIDSMYFPNTQNNGYWSSSPYADVAFRSVWIVGFHSGDDFLSDAPSTQFVRLVRSAY